MNVKVPYGELVVEAQAQRYRQGALEFATVSLAREVAYTLFVNDKEILSIAALPSNLRELFIGFLVSEGVLFSPGEVLDCQVDRSSKLVAVELDVPAERLEKLERKGMLTSGCAGGMIFSLEAARVDKPSPEIRMQVAGSSIVKRMQELDTHPGIYRETKGVHGASVATPERTLVILEDLGRHNAVDKIVGHCFLSGIRTSDKLLLTTGRITSEVLTKASRGGFPMIVSRSSVSALASQMASQCSIDVASYTRAGRFNYFSNGGVELVIP